MPPHILARQYGNAPAQHAQGLLLGQHLWLELDRAHLIDKLCELVRLPRFDDPLHCGGPRRRANSRVIG
eukprot:8414091-Pyramimonas_sp.AAC.1